MYVVSDEFKTLAHASHTACFKLEVLTNGAVVYTIENREDEAGTGIAGGSVTLDSTADVLAHGSVTIADRDGDLLPLLPTDELRPSGNELRLWRGIVVDGEPEYVPLCTGPMLVTRVSESSSGYSIDVDFYDRAKALSFYAWSTVYSVAAGTNVATALLALIADRFPADVYATMVPSFVTTAAVTPALVFGGSGTNDPGKDAVDLAAGAGLLFAFDRLGNPVLREFPDPLTQDIAETIAEGVNLVDIDSELSADGGYNGVTVYGQPPDNSAGYYAEAWDDDPASETYYLGKYGKRPKPISDPKITSNTAAQTRADGELQALSGVFQKLNFGAIVNPALDPLDVVLIARARLGIDDRYVLSSLEVPLDVETAMSAVCRVRNG